MFDAIFKIGISILEFKLQTTLHTPATKDLKG